MSSLRQGIFQWEIPNSPELPEAAQMRCRELLSYMLLAAITGYIVFLLSLASAPGPVIAQRRALCTALGGSIALG